MCKYTGMDATQPKSPSPVTATGQTVGLNHAVLFVSDPERSADFYSVLLGLEVVARMGGGVFLRSPSSRRDHDLGLFPASGGGGARGTVGLYHLAWEVPTLGDLAVVGDRLQESGSLVGAADHGATKSFYGQDPDGIDFEVMWQIPTGEAPRSAPVTRLLDLNREIERYGAATRGG